MGIVISFEAYRRRRAGAAASAPPVRGMSAEDRAIWEEIYWEQKIAALDGPDWNPAHRRAPASSHGLKNQDE